MEEDCFVDSLTTCDGIHGRGDTHHRRRRPRHHRRRFSAPAKSNNRAPSPVTKVHELLECPLCSKSMFPPIHQVFNCYNQYFCLHFEAFHLGIAPVFIAFLRFMGDAAEARSFSYRLEVGSNSRKLIWEGTPRSICDSHQKVRDSHDGLIVQRNMALFFSGGDGKELKLRISGRIWKDNSA